MALPDYFKSEHGTPKTWKNTGGDYALTLTSLANAAAREGVKGDLGAAFAKEWWIFFTSSVAVTTTNGKEIELWWGASTSTTAGTDNPGNLGGTDAAFSNPDELKFQLLFIGAIILSNARGTNIQKQGFVFSPPTRYGSPMVINKSGQALGATAGDHVITFTPLEFKVQELVT